MVKVMLQASLNDLTGVLLPISEDGLRLDKLYVLFIQSVLLVEAGHFLLTMGNYVPIVVETEVSVLACLVVECTHSASAINFLFDLRVWGGAKKEMCSIGLDKDRQDERVDRISHLFKVDK